MEEDRHNDSHHYRIDKQDSGRNTCIHIVITLKQEK